MKRTSPEQGKKGRRFTFRDLILSSLLSILLGMGLTIGVLFTRLDENGLSVIQALTVVRGQFVGEYEWNEVVDDTLNTMVTSLGDRWSYYLTPKEYEQILQTRTNSYTGIGVTISQDVGNSIVILSVAKDSPAEEVGIKAGDAILSVEGVRVTKENWTECVDLIRGEEGTPVNLIIKEEAGGPRPVEVMRKEILSIPAEHLMLDNQIGLIRLRNFYSGSGAALIAAVDTLAGEGAKAIIFDLRDNPGGYVTELTKMLDHLLPEGNIFISRTLDGEETVYTSDENRVNLPFAVIVNGDSYSAAEFFAAELRESVGATVIGEVTSGKGYAQQLFPLQNGSAIGLSTSRYFTGAGVSLIGKGITPDVELSLSEEQRKLQLQEKLPHEEDPQLQAAISAMSK